MINKTIKLLLLTKNSSLAKRISASLSYAQIRVFNVTWGQEKEQILKLVNRTAFDIILLDLSVAKNEFTDIVKQLLHYSPRSIIILLCNDNDRPIAMQAMTQGATDVIDKNRLGQNWLMKVLGYNLVRAQAFKLHNDSTKTLREICFTSQLGIMVSDLFGNIIYTNPAFNGITGYCVDQCKGHHWTSQIPYDDRARLIREWQDAQKDNQIVCSDVSLIHQNTYTFQIRVIATPIEKQKKLYGYIVTIEDLTERDDKAKFASFTKDGLDLLPATTAQLTLEAMSDAILSSDIDNKLLYMNKAAATLTGWNHHEAVGKFLSDIFKIKASTTTPSAETYFLQRQQQNIDCILVRKDGVDVPIEKSTRPIINEFGQKIGAVIIFRDITKSKLTAIKMTHLAQHDPLTGLPNRLLFQERLNQAIVLAKRHNKRLAVLYLDIDLFKQVNDLQGHEIGDKLLCSVANRITDAIRLSDTVCRQGGDEFLILLSEIGHAKDAATFSNKLLNSLISPHHIKGKKISIHMSIGIRIFYHDDEAKEHHGSEGELSDILIDNADQAMYQAKSHGHDGYKVFKTR